MELNERKIKILQAIINDYVDTGDPVGSRTISKKYDLGVSSATIRNEMSDLEEMGLIHQPHASSGRVPSDKGYRLYVDQFLEMTTLKPEQLLAIQQLLQVKIAEIDILMKQASQLISYLTNYTSMISSPQISKSKIKHIQLLPIDQYAVLMTLITNENAIKNKIIQYSHKMETSIFEKVSKMLNEKLGGLTLEQIHLPLIFQIQQQLGEYQEILNPVLTTITEIIQTIDQQKIFMSGTTNLLNYPEFNNVEKVKNILNMFENTTHMNRVLEISNTQIPGELEIKIGKENQEGILKDCSIVKATYSLGGEVVGTIGVIGPTRMDYSKTIAVIETMAKDLNEVLTKLFSG